jgi:RNA polymerase sigma-70 factor (ECF subfamily)
MHDDRVLMKRVGGGDERAFETLVGRFTPRLLGVARRLLGSPADAEDAVQRAFLRCYTGASTYRPEWAVSTWLYRILINICVDDLRRRAARTAGDASARHQLAGRQQSPPSRRNLDLESALRQVPREARLLLALRYTDGLSYREMARIRGISVNTVKSQLSRGKSILRAALERPRRAVRRDTISRGDAR